MPANGDISIFHRIVGITFRQQTDFHTLIDEN